MTENLELTALVEQWLPNQRWFAGRGRTGSLTLRAIAELPGATALPTAAASVTIWAAALSYDDGGTELYQIPTVSYDARMENLTHALIGSIPSADGITWIYDALHDKRVTGAWLAGIRDQSTAGRLRFTRLTAPENIPLHEPSLVLTVEQSNTSLLFSDTAILKVFRRLQPGINPDVEIHERLTERGANHVAELLGAVAADIDGEQYSLAMLQQFLRSATDGWALATTSVRDLMAEGDLHADEAGGDFAAEAERLGAVVASVHAELAEAFGTSTASADHLRRRAAAMANRLDRGVQIVGEIAPYAPALRQIYDNFAATPGPWPLQRIHGDLHLGQTLRTVRRWVILDFEGEPVADMAARRLPDSPVRDIAGMLRSFDYAGWQQLIDTEPSAQLAYRAAEWMQRNRAAFLDGYARASGHDPRERAAALRAFQADKAVYEAAYERRYRPSWLQIPLGAISRLVEGEPST